MMIGITLTLAALSRIAIAEDDGNPRDLIYFRQEIETLKGVEAAEHLVVLDRVVIGSNVRQVALLDQIPMIEIETATRHPERLAGNSEGGSGSRMNELGRRRVLTRTAFAPATRLASLEKSEDRKITLGDRRHRDRCPQRPGHRYRGHHQTPPPRSAESLVPVLHSHPQAGALVRYVELLAQLSTRQASDSHSPFARKEPTNAA